MLLNNIIKIIYMGDRKIDWNKISDSVVAEYEKSNKIELIYKYLEFITCIKQDNEVLRVIKNKVLFNKIIEFIIHRYDYTTTRLNDLVSSMWTLQNREICKILLDGDETHFYLSDELLIDKMHKMFIENWSEVLKLSYNILGQHLLSCHPEKDEFDIKHKEIRNVYEGYVKF